MSPVVVKMIIFRGRIIQGVRRSRSCQQNVTELRWGKNVHGAVVFSCRLRRPLGKSQILLLRCCISKSKSSHNADAIRLIYSANRIHQVHINRISNYNVNIIYVAAAVSNSYIILTHLIQIYMLILYNWALVVVQHTYIWIRLISYH